MKRRGGCARRGLVLVCVIACLVVASALIGMAVQSALRGRRESRLQLQLRQTELLCEAGVMRATKQLDRNADYTGELWRPELNLENYHEAVVQIEVNPEPSEASGSSRNVTVTAKLDSYLDRDGPMQRTHNFTIPIQMTSTLTENP